MAEYIEKQALIKALEADFNTDWADYASKNNFDKDYIDGVRDEYDDVMEIICKQRNLTEAETEIYNNRLEAEAADVQPVKRGRWEEVPDWYDNDVHYRCSACNAEFYLEVGTPEYNEYWYCPHCGADMRDATKG